MCGIVGYVGRRAAQPRLLRGLEALEYRGYDSAGLCLLEPGGLQLVRAVGPLANLRVKVNGHGGGACTGIGHTRWATHGPVSERNAHPLTAGEVAIVLNGIVENHRELRDELPGAAFTSETDAEVVAHLVRREFAGDLPEAVRRACARLEGHFAFIAVHRDRPGLLVGARRECPLLIGRGAGETYLASSMAAFAGEIDRVQLLEDGEVVTATAERVRIAGAGGEPRRRRATPLTGGPGSASRDGYESFMLKEIDEQPAAVAATLAANAELPVALRPRRIVLLACGTAYHAGLVGRYAIEAWAGIPCEPEIASEWRYRDPRLEPGTLVVAISQSGETADTLAGLRLARARGAATLAVTNTAGSQITREADAVAYTHAGLEVGVAATKTFTAQLAVMYLLALGLAKGRLPEAERAALHEEVRALPLRLAECLAGQAPAAAAALRHHRQPFFLYLGRHAGLPVCLEGALKLKEVAYVPTEAYAAGEMKHGPIALLGPRTPVVCVATRSHVAAKLRSNLEEVRARGAHVVAVATAGDAAIGELAEDVCRVPATHPLLQPALAVVPLQLLAYHVARLRGLDMDRPRNLAKTVTVE